MDGSGCNTCPAYKKCTAVYRGSRCAHNRATYGVESDPFTNADRIRAMSDEELADWLARTQIANTAEVLAIAKIPFEYPPEMRECVTKESLEWLKQPAVVADNG